MGIGKFTTEMVVAAWGISATIILFLLQKAEQVYVIFGLFLIAWLGMSIWMIHEIIEIKSVVNLNGGKTNGKKKK